MLSIGWFVVGLVGSLFVANAVAWWLHFRQQQRIYSKIQSLSQKEPICSLSGSQEHAQMAGSRKATADDDADREEQEDGDDDEEEENENDLDANEEMDGASAGTSAALIGSVPVTILTGFLGSGKTTLINRILRMPSLPFKVMVLENEIGSISIDHELLSANQRDVADGIYVLANGCMCCKASSDKNSANELERILDYLLRIVDTQGFDYVLVETTGLADPGPILETFLQLRASRFRLDGVVTMVDAYASQSFWHDQKQQYEFPIELQRQLLYADVIVYNKQDLVQPHDLQRLQETIARINEEAIPHECVNAQVELTNIIGIHTFDIMRYENKSNANGHGENRTRPRDLSEELTTERRNLSRGSHTADINTVHFNIRGDVDIALFGEWLSMVVDEYSRKRILRIKGILSIANDPHRCVVQCALDTYTLAPGRAWKSPRERVSKIVVIGKQLDQQLLEQGFVACVVNPRSPVAQLVTCRTLNDLEQEEMQLLHRQTHCQEQHEDQVTTDKTTPVCQCEQVVQDKKQV